MASVARHHGQDIPLSVIREASGTSSAGTSIKGILDACPQIGFRAAAFKSDDKQLESLCGIQDPVILHIVNARGDLHFVVLEGLAGRYARVMDPEYGKVRRIPTKELREAWTGYLVTMVPDPDLAGEPGPSSGKKDLTSCLRLIPVPAT